MKNFVRILGSILVSLALVACEKQPNYSSGIPTAGAVAPTQVAPAVQPQQAPVQAPQQPAPVVVNNESSSLMPALLGAAAGYMLGSSGRSDTRVVEREVIREVPNNRPAVVQPMKPSAPNFSAPAVPKVAPAIVPAPTAPVQPKPAPSFSQGSYASIKQAAPTYRSSPSPSFSRPSGSRR